MKHDHPHPWRRRATRVVVLLASMGLALVLLEALVVRTNLGGVLYYRETHRYIQEAIRLLPEADRPDGRIFENRPGAKLELFDFTYCTDGLGLRSASSDPDARPVRREGVPRVLFLGDSVTLGWGVEDSATWIRLLEARAREAGQPIECLNAGHLQYSTVQEADWFAAHGPELAPDLVVLTFVVNDLDDAYGTYQQLKASMLSGVEPGRLDRLVASLRGHFPGLTALARLAENRREARGFEELDVVAPVDRPEYVERSAAARVALDRLLADCEALGAELVLLDHSAPQLPVAEEWCRERGVGYHDLRFDAEEWAQDIRNSLADAHANALGNCFLADKAEAALATTRLLGERSAARHSGE